MALRAWSKPTLPKATVEDPNDPVLGWTVQQVDGPTQAESYAPWKNAKTAPTGKYPTGDSVNSTY